MQHNSEKSFGFLLDEREVEFECGLIRPLTDHSKKKAIFYDTCSVSEGWIYAPEIELNKSFNERKRFKARAPIISDRYFSMPPTHRIVSNSLNDDELLFFIKAYSLIMGCYLSPDGHLNPCRIPYETGKLTGLIPSNQDQVRALNQIFDFYSKANIAKREQAMASIHWYLFGQCSSLYPWEFFDAQYKVLDGVFALVKEDLSNSRYATGKNKYISHTKRSLAMAEHFGIELPSWAQVTSNGSSKLSTARNALSHEAKYGGAPIGYAHPEENYQLELTAFCLKLLCAALGIKTSYLTVDPKSREYHVWDISE